jgi:predicted transcriptional regulator
MSRRRGTSGRAYRTKVEVFRDVLAAVRLSSKKTRIIGLANLNPATFRRHMTVARSHGLVTVIGGDYLLTDKANRVLDALDQLVAKSRELDDVVQLLERNALPTNGEPWTSGAVLRNISRMAWNDVQRTGEEYSTPFARSGGSTALSGKALDSMRAPIELLRAPAAMKESRAPAPPSRRASSSTALPAPVASEPHGERTRS